MLVQYVRDPKGLKTKNAKGQTKWKGQKRGVMIAIANAKARTIIIGWSMCGPEDKFDKQLGTDIAIGRAVRCHGLSLAESGIPESIRPQIKAFANRVRDYYKSGFYPTWATECFNPSPNFTGITSKEIVSSDLTVSLNQPASAYSRPNNDGASSTFTGLNSLVRQSIV